MYTSSLYADWELFSKKLHFVSDITKLITISMNVRSIQDKANLWIGFPTPNLKEYAL